MQLQATSKLECFGCLFFCAQAGDGGERINTWKITDPTIGWMIKIENSLQSILDLEFKL